MERPTPLRVRRLLLGLTLVQVGNAVGADPSLVSLVERGLKKSAPLETKLAAFLTTQERLVPTTRPSRAAV